MIQLLLSCISATQRSAESEEVMAFQNKGFEEVVTFHTDQETEIAGRVFLKCANEKDVVKSSTESITVILNLQIRAFHRLTRPCQVWNWLGTKL